ncbi:MAG: adenylosuccinate lyase, partial [Candidatus Dormibacteraeota bacterium]|nr:adenylosuccinate lyase [Candidatus Dormibacteraeota bacterium]
MISRYAHPRIREVWSPRSRFDRWLRIEILTAEAWGAMGRIPADDVDRIRGASYQLERIDEVEREVGHDVIAFLTAMGETLGPESRWVHLGLTSSDILDTAMATQLVDSADILLEELEVLTRALEIKAIAHRDTMALGRSHGIAAEPLTFGFKLAGYVAELQRDRARLLAAREEVAVGQLSGPVGTHSSVDPEIEEFVCQKLGLRPDPAATQVIARDRHAAFLAALALTAGTLERLATEVRHLMRTEVGELREPFTEKQKGSSAMPHKRNPVIAERLCGLARVIRGNLQVALENTALWHERDISHSSAERIVFPDSCELLGFMLTEATRMVAGMVVYPERMAANLNVAGGVVFSQRVLLALVEKGMSRDDAYRIVQAAALKAWDEGGDFRKELEADARVGELLTLEEIGELFDAKWHVRHLDTTYKRLGIG